MKLKLFKKFFFITTTIIVISLTVMMLILSLVLNYYISRNAYKTLRESCEQVALTAESIENYIDEDNFLTLLKTVANVGESDIFVTDENGAVLVCSCSEWQENKKCLHSSYIVPNDIIEKAEKEDDLFISTIGMYKFPQYVASRPINTTEPYYIFATSPPSQVKELMTTVSKIYFLLAIVPVVIMFFAIYTMTYRLTKPLKSMSEAAKAMAKGDFSKRIPVTSNDDKLPRSA